VTDKARGIAPPEFVLFVNDPKLMTEAYCRYLEARIREAEPYSGLPIILSLRARARDVPRRGL
jgi:GTP-binding protein